MKQPSSDEFRDWIEFARKPPPGLTHPADWARQLPPEDVLLKYFVDARGPWAEYIKSLREMPAQKWLIEQPEFRRADKLVFSTRKKMAEGPAPDELFWAKCRMERLKRSFVDRRGSIDVTNNPSLLAFRERDLSTLLEGSFAYAGTWDFHVMVALQEYYYGDSCKQSMAVSKALAGQLHGLVKACGQVQASLDLIEDLADEPSARRFLSTATRIERQAQELLQNYSSIHAAIPITRNDPHMKERLFVRRMWRTNKSTTGSPKPDAIYELMWLPGFEHQYERRHVEKLCAEFTGKKHSKKPPL